MTVVPYGTVHVCERWAFEYEPAQDAGAEMIKDSAASRHIRAVCGTAVGTGVERDCEGLNCESCSYGSGAVNCGSSRCLGRAAEADCP